jgi:hypothetical protein
MPDDAPASGWDFLTLVSWWNLYGLPVLLILVGLGLVAWRRKRQGISSRDFVAVRTMALVYLGLGLRAAVGLAQELLTLRAQGIPQSNPVTGMILPVVAVVVSLAIGHGLWRLRPWAHRVAIIWNVLAAATSALVTAWQWRYRAVVRPDQWPDYLVSAAVPWLLLVILLLPSVRAVFREPPALEVDSHSTSAPRPTLVSIALLLLLLVVASTLAVDALDWTMRSLAVAEN